MGDGMPQMLGTGARPGAVNGQHAMHEAPMDASASMAHADKASASDPRAHGSASLPPHHHAGAHCDMACAPASCGSAGHCSTAAVSSENSATAALASVFGRQIAGRDGAPHSVSTAPEPPPPRA